MTKREPDEIHPKYERTGLNRFLRTDRAKPKRRPNLKSGGL
jgi:hypothetical protein